MIELLIGFVIGLAVGWFIFSLVYWRTVEKVAKQEIARAAAILKEPSTPPNKPYRTMWGDVTNQPMKKNDPLK